MGDRRGHERAIVGAYFEALRARGVEYTWEECSEDFVFMKLHGLWAVCIGAGIFAGKNFQAKTGIFAPEPSEDEITERQRNCLLFAQVVDDLRHSKWTDMLRSLPEDPEA